jgi:3-methyladenine DNA glycosylase AlkD
MNNIELELTEMVDEERAKINAWFFKTAEGEYGHGDRFLGVRVPQVRQVIKSNLKHSSLNDAVSLLKSPWHEVRLAGCILMVALRKKAVKTGNEEEKERIFKTYLKNTKYINNWDLVDVSAPDIVGEYLMERDRSVLNVLAKSTLLWERRIAVIATGAFIKRGQHDDVFSICNILLNDKHDLIHKACGWMLREVGKNCGRDVLNEFLDAYAQTMPRTMLRYALEKHDEAEKRKFMTDKRENIKKTKRNKGGAS